MSYRRREIGIRMALGATRQSVARLILRQGSMVIGSGLGIGLVLAFATRTLGGELPISGALAGHFDLCRGSRSVVGNRIARGSSSRAESRLDRPDASLARGLKANESVDGFSPNDGPSPSMRKPVDVKTPFLAISSYKDNLRHRGQAQSRPSVGDGRGVAIPMAERYVFRGLIESRRRTDRDRFRALGAAPSR